MRRPHRDCARPAFEFLSVSCRGIGQQWPASGAGALDFAVLGVAQALLEEVAITPNKAAKQMTHKLHNNYTKQILSLLRKLCDPQHISQPGDLAKGLRTPREFDLGGQWDLITELPQDW